MHPGIIALAVGSFALTAFGTYQNFEQAKEAADAQRDNIELQRQKLELQKEVDAIEKAAAEADAIANARKARSQIAMKQAISGTEGSVYDTMSTGVDTQLYSGMEELSQRYDIRSSMTDLSEQSLDIQEGSIQSSWDMELGALLGIGSAAVNSGMLLYKGMEGKNKGNADMSLFDDNTYGSGNNSFFTKQNSTPISLIS